MKYGFSVAIALGFLAATPAYASSLKESIASDSKLPSEVSQALKKQTGLRSLKSFKIDFANASCLDFATESDPNASMGVCVLSVSAFQLNATVSVTEKYEGSVVTVIYADVE